jgi:hypothetical protein
VDQDLDQQPVSDQEHQQQPRQGPFAAHKKRKGQGKQQQQPKGAAAAPDAAAAELPVRNSFIAACLAEGGRGGKPRKGRRKQPKRQAGGSAAAAAAAEPDSDPSDTEDENDGSDFSDLEDFIVCGPSTDYRKLLPKVGTQVSWRQAWGGAGNVRR